MSNLYQRVLGNPFVYNHVRPFAIGGLDLSPFYRQLTSTSSSVIVDVGCGTGHALLHVKSFAEYAGLDTDPTAIGFARKRHSGRHNVSFECRRLTTDDVKRLSPTHVILGGLLHHLTDDECVGLLQQLRESPRLEQVITFDIVYLRGKWVSNFLAMMDRGRYCRKIDDYRALAERGGFDVSDSMTIRCHPRTGLAWYFIMNLTAKR